jgi:hypothetical protein
MKSHRGTRGIALDRDEWPQLQPKHVAANKLVNAGVVCDWLNTHTCVDHPRLRTQVATAPWLLGPVVMWRTPTAKAPWQMPSPPSTLPTTNHTRTSYRHADVQRPERPLLIATHVNYRWWCPTAPTIFQHSYVWSSNEWRKTNVSAITVSIDCVLLTKYHSGDQIKKIEKGRKCSTMEKRELYAGF